MSINNAHFINIYFTNYIDATFFMLNLFFNFYPGFTRFEKPIRKINHQGKVLKLSTKREMLENYCFRHVLVFENIFI